MPRILVVDDDPSVRNFLRRGLTLEGFVVEVAEDGVSGLEQCERFGPDLVILDRMMPNLGGLDTLARLRGMRPDLPVIIFSATNPEADLDLPAGSTYLVKPIAFEELMETIQALLADLRLDGKRLERKRETRS